MPEIWLDVNSPVDVPANVLPLVSDGDFKTRATGVAYNAASMDLSWLFVTSGGAQTETPVVPGTGGDHGWSNLGDGMYKLRLPATGAPIKNDTAGYGWLVGLASGVLPWRGPVCGFRSSALNDAFTDGTSPLAVNVTQWAGNTAGDLYTADVQFTRDQANTQDEYTVTWYKNGVRQTSGITSPTIQVIKRVDGTDLVASTAMTQISTTGSYKYDTTGAGRQTVGEAVLVVVGATIDAAGRSFSRLVGRDSS